MTDIGNPAAPGGANSFVVGKALAAGIVPQITPTHAFGRKRSHDRFSLVRAAVADDDQFKVTVCLRQDRLDGWPDVAAAAIGRQNNREKTILAHDQTPSKAIGNN